MAIFAKNRQHFPALIYLVFALPLLLFWLDGVLKHHNWYAMVVAGLTWVILLFLFFLLAGFEVAYTVLRDKDLDQVKLELRAALQEMQSKESYLYEAKEWCTIFVTVGISLLAEWHIQAHSDLILPHQLAGSAPLPFVLAFTTVPILWLCLGPAKRLATRNPQEFLLFLRGVTWKVLRRFVWLIETLRLSSPSEYIVKTFGGFPPKGTLLLSLGAHYLTTMRRLGYGIHQFRENVEIRPDGSGTITLTIAAYLIVDLRKINGYIRVDAPSTGSVAVLAGFRAEFPGDRVAELNAQLDELMSRGTKQIGADPVLAGVQCFAGADSKDPNKLNYEIDLPFDPTANGGNAFLLLYVVKANFAAKGFRVPISSHEVPDYFQRTFDWPCRQYDLNIAFVGEVPGVFASTTCQVTFGEATHPAERDRVQRLTLGGGTQVIENKLPYPLPGAQYRLDWKVWYKA